MSDCWRKANPGLSWGKPCPQCGTYVRIYGDGAAEKQNLDGWLRNCPTPREQLNRIRAWFGKPPINKAAPDGAWIPAGAAAGCRISRAPLPPPSAAPEAVTPRAWAVSDTDDFGPLSALPLVIPASLVLWAVIAAAWIALL